MRYRAYTYYSKSTKYYSCFAFLSFFPSCIFAIKCISYVYKIIVKLQKLDHPKDSYLPHLCPICCKTNQNAFWNLLGNLGQELMVRISAFYWVTSYYALTGITMKKIKIKIKNVFEFFFLIFCESLDGSAISAYDKHRTLYESPSVHQNS